MDNLMPRYHMGRDYMGDASWTTLARLVKDINLEEISRVIDAGHATFLQENLPTQSIYQLVEKEKAKL